MQLAVRQPALVNDRNPAVPMDEPVIAYGIISQVGDAHRDCRQAEPGMARLQFRKQG